MDLRDIKEFCRDCFGYFVTFVIIVLFFTFIIAFHPVAGNSMTPTLEEGDITVVSKFYHHLFDIKRNQIAIVKKESKTYIKRVVGLPGEYIYYLDDSLYVNGNKQEETFLNNVHTNGFTLEDVCDETMCPNGVIPDDYYLVLGDNRTDSIDSRDSEFGLVNKKEIQGIVLFRMWPVNNMKRL